MKEKRYYKDIISLCECFCKYGRCVATSLLLLLFSNNIWATDYYFSNDGDDNNLGTIASPWKTLAKATEISKQANNGR